MNIIEINRLTDCRERLNNICPMCIKEAEELKKIKDTLDDLLEFKVFPNYPGLTD